MKIQSSSATSMIVLFSLVGLLMASPGLSGYELFQTLTHQVAGFDGLDDVEAVAISPDGFHVYTGGRDTLSVFERDPGTGQLSLLQSLQASSDGHGIFFLSELVISPDGLHLYASSQTTPGLAVFSRDSAIGLLELVEVLSDNVGGVDGLRTVGDLEISPDGRHVFTVAILEAEVAVFERDLTTGSLTLIDLENGTGELPDLRFPEGAALSPDGAYLYVADRLSGLLTFERDIDSGELTFLRTLSVGQVPELMRPRDVVVDPSGETLYLTGFPSVVGGAIVVFQRDAMTGGLSRLEAELGETNGWSGTESLFFDPSGANLYLSDGNQLTVFARNDGGELSFLQTFEDDTDGVEGLGSIGLGALDPTGKHLYLPALADEAIAVFERSSANGELSFVDAFFEGEGAIVDGLGNPGPIHASSDGRDLYVLGKDHRTLTQLRRNSTGLLERGQLLELAPLGFPENPLVLHFEPTPDQRLLFLGTASPGLYVFERQLPDGRLDFLGRGDFIGFNGGFTISPDSRFLFASPFGDDLEIYEIQAASGQLVLRTTFFSFGGFPFITLAAAPDGRIYAGGKSSDEAVIGVFEWNEANDSLTLVSEIGSDLLGERITRLIVTPDGRHVIAAGRGETSAGPAGLVVFARDSGDGSLSEVQSWVGEVGNATDFTDPFLGDISPSGTRLVTDTPPYSTFFSRDPMTGLLSVLEQRRRSDGNIPPGLIGFTGLQWSPQGDQFYVAASSADALYALEEGGASICVPTSTTLCLGEDDRFRVEVAWTDFTGQTGPGTLVTRSADSGLFWFFDSDNWEMLVKVIDGCSFNGHFWVFSAATTNVDYTLTVTDTQTGEQAVYRNPLGTAAAAITDNTALATCP